MMRNWGLSQKLVIFFITFPSTFTPMAHVRKHKNQDYRKYRQTEEIISYGQIGKKSFKINLITIIYSDHEKKE